MKVGELSKGVGGTFGRLILFNTATYLGLGGGGDHAIGLGGGGIMPKMKNWCATDINCSQH